jgi:hypothetical protein
MGELGLLGRALGLLGLLGRALGLLTLLRPLWLLTLLGLLGLVDGFGLRGLVSSRSDTGAAETMVAAVAGRIAAAGVGAAPSILPQTVQ